MRTVAASQSFHGFFTIRALIFMLFSWTRTSLALDYKLAIVDSAGCHAKHSYKER